MTTFRAFSAAGLALILGSCSTGGSSPLLAVPAGQTGDTRYLDEIAEMDGVPYTGTLRSRTRQPRTQPRSQDRLARASSTGMPSIDIKRSCDEARPYSSNEDKELDFRACVNDETSARTQIAGLWPSVKSVDRQDCGALGRPPAPRYVEILTCLQISSGGIRSTATASVPAARDHVATLPPSAAPARKDR